VADIRNRLGEEPVAPAEQAGHFLDLVELGPNPPEIVGRSPVADPAGSQLPNGMGRDQLQNRCKLDGLECVGADLVR
jgi:hypothetical protein